MDLNIGYFFTLHGILFIAQFILSMIVVICVGVVKNHMAADGAVFFTCICCMITSFIFIIVNLLNIPANASHVPWILIRLFVSAFWALFYFISLWICVAGAAQKRHWEQYDVAAYTAAAVFCAFTLIICAWDAIIYFFKYRQGPTAQNPT